MIRSSGQRTSLPCVGARFKRLHEAEHISSRRFESRSPTSTLKNKGKFEGTTREEEAILQSEVPGQGPSDGVPRLVQPKWRFSVEFNKIKVEARKWRTGKVRLVARPQVGAGCRSKFQGESLHLWSCYGALKPPNMGVPRPQERSETLILGLLG